MTRENILSHIRVGQKVYDANGEVVGTVDFVDHTAGCLSVETNPFTEAALCIPVDLIRSIDLRELFLSRMRDEVRRDRAKGHE